MANYDEQLGLHDDNVTIIDEGLDIVERIVALNPNSQYQNLPIASTIAPGIAQFDAEFFAVDGDGNVSLVKDLAEAADNAKEFADEAAKSANEAAKSANEAEQSANMAVESATTAGSAANSAVTSATEAGQSANMAAESATQAAQSASVALASQNEAATQAQYSYQSRLAAGASQTNAAASASQAANSATEAQGYAYQAQQYAQKHYQIVASYDALPRPGDSAYIYLVPSSSSTAGDEYLEYLEYLWVAESTDYELIGTTGDINLENYAQINGTYPNMTVGNATTAGKVANLLTINLNGQPYQEYNGSQAVSIDITSAGSSTEVILAASGWSENRQDITLENITAASNVDIYPKDISAAAYINAGILVSQTDEKLIFTCVTTPSTDITIVVEVAA